MSPRRGAAQQSPGTQLRWNHKHAPWVSCCCSERLSPFQLWVALPSQDCTCTYVTTRKKVQEGMKRELGGWGLAYSGPCSSESPCFSPSLSFQIVAVPGFLMPDQRTGRSGKASKPPSPFFFSSCVSVGSNRGLYQNGAFLIGVNRVLEEEQHASLIILELSNLPVLKYGYRFGKQKTEVDRARCTHL